MEYPATASAQGGHTMSEMSWQLRHPEYGLMRIDLEETTAR